MRRVLTQIVPVFRERDGPAVCFSHLALQPSLPSLPPTPFFRSLPLVLLPCRDIIG